jgi:23S rRNA pseudouridine2457 synthase
MTARRQRVSPVTTARLLLLNKPFGVVCQFTPAAGHPSLADFVPVKGVYPAGRLDRDSEGLVVLSNHGPLIHRISHPRHKLPKTYWVQVEGTPTPQQLAELARGVRLKDGLTAPATVRQIAEPDGLWPRNPPVRFRKTVSDSWLEMRIHEGRNRQVRRMTAAVGLPTLRLVRLAVGNWSVKGLAPGEWRETEAVVRG